MYIGSVLRSWLCDYLRLDIREHRHRKTRKVYRYSYCIKTCPGYDRPEIYETINAQYYRYDCIINVGEEWIKDNVPKETLVSSIAERMCNDKESINFQFSLA